MRAWSVFAVLLIMSAAPAGGQVTQPSGRDAPPPAVTPRPPAITPAPIAAPLPQACRTDGGDADRDGHLRAACGGDDCDDNDRNRYPGNPEVADPRHDEDCDLTTFGDRDTDGDGYPDSRACNIVGGSQYCGSDCDDQETEVHPGAPDHCDRRDNDCDGDVDNQVLATLYHDNDRDGFGNPAEPVLACFQDIRPGLATNNYDCNDADPTINPITGTCR